MKEILLFYKSPLIYGTHFCGFLLATAGVSESLRAIVTPAIDWLKFLFPVIQNYGNRSAFGDTSEVYFSFMFLVGPIWFVRWIKLPQTVVPDPQSVLDRYCRNPILAHTSMFFVIILILLAYFSFRINPGFDFALAPINSSRLALGLLGPIFSIYISYGVLAFSIISFKLLLSHYGR